MYKNYPITRNTVFRCFAECLFVKGAIRSTIYDLPRREYDLIPNGLYEIIKQFEGKTINKIKDSFEEEYLAIIDEYFDFL